MFGKIGYMAPEVFRQYLYSKAADVYSFGIILWELTSCRMPFSNERQDIHLIYDIIEGRRPEIVEGTPPDFAKLIQDCWNSDPNLRPTMEEVHNRIWKFSNSMIKGNRKDVFGFKAAEEKRSLSLLTISKQIYPQVIHSQRIWNESHIPRLPFTIGLVKNGTVFKEFINVVLLIFDNSLNKFFFFRFN